MWFAYACIKAMNFALNMNYDAILEYRRIIQCPDSYGGTIMDPLMCSLYSS